MVPPLAGNTMKKFPQMLCLDMLCIRCIQSFFVPFTLYSEYDYTTHHKNEEEMLVKWIQNDAEKSTKDNAGPRVIIK